MTRCLTVVVVAALAAAPAAAQNQGFNDVVKKVSAKVEPASAKRGEAVAWMLTVELADGWHTYPTTQADPKAESYTNRIKFPKENGLVFVGELEEPKTVEKTEDGSKVAMIEGAGTWKRTLVISPEAKPGKVTVKVPITILACADRCLPPQKVYAEVELTISDAPAVPVDPKYKNELTAPSK
jgi:DsbC/DsbD-like thiol-disulfide interchange protein